MTFPVVGSNIPGVYEITNSIRLNDNDSAGFSRTNQSSPTDAKIFTWSGWVKRGNVDTSSALFNGASGNNVSSFYFRGSGSQNYIRLVETSNGFVSYDTLIDTQMLFRDVSAWYHIVLKYDSTNATANDRAIIYVNGVQVDLTISNTVDTNYTSPLNEGSYSNYLGRASGGNYMDGYMAEVHLIDGQALSPTDFGEFDEDSGVWKPKIYEGTYGTNGFYLKFNNTGNMGEDSSGNDNTWTPTNLSGTTDVTTDTPTNNFCTMNPLAVTTAGTATFSEGNCQVATVVSGSMGGYSTLEIPSSGVWYCEAKITTSGVTNAYIGLVPYSATDSNSFVNGNSVFYYGNGTKYVNGSNSAYGTGWSQNDIIGIKVDADSSTVEFYLNGSSQGSISHSVANMHFNCGDTNPSVSHTFQWNFGSPVYSISSGNSDANGYGNFEYSPSGGLALCTQNLATALSPTIDDGSQYFNTILYTGTGSTLSLTGVGFQPDWVWGKCRIAAQQHRLFDSSRGVLKNIISSAANAEATTANSLTSFDSDGFTLGSDDNLNFNTRTFVAWNWKANGGTTSSNTDGSITSTVQANTTAGFSIVTFTGNATAGATVGHGLGVKPEIIFSKNRSNGNNWNCYVEAVDNTGDYTLTLNGAGAKSNSFNMWNDTAPTSSVITLGNRGETNGSGHNMVHYVFHSVEGYSKFGSYTGNGSTDGTFAYTGFRPAFVIYKNSSSATDWRMFDNKRNTFNVIDGRLFPNASSAENTSQDTVDFLSNGFKLRATNSGDNGSGNTFIYMAFAENPFVTSGATPVTAR